MEVGPGTGGPPFDLVAQWKADHPLVDLIPAALAAAETGDSGPAEADAAAVEEEATGAVEAVETEAAAAEEKLETIVESKTPGEVASRNPAQDKLLSKGEIQKLKDAGYDIHDLKPGKGTDLYKDNSGNIYVKPKGGAGPGDPAGMNINDF